MLEALCDGKPIRASKDLKGKGLKFRCKDNECEHPELTLVVGRGLKIPHFRHLHKGKCSCAEGETDWHLEWKSHFDQIEVDMGIDEVTGERNRADAVVGKLVIEFQHSAIKEEEQQARERYDTGTGGMIWVVDASGTRMRDRLLVASHVTPPFVDLAFEPFKGFTQSNLPVASFGPIWSNRPVGVAFDYGPGYDMIFVLPVNGDERAPKCLCKWYKKAAFIEAVKNHPEEFICPPVWYVEDVERKKRAEEEKTRIEEATRQLYQQEFVRAVAIASQKQDPRTFPKSAVLEKLEHFNVYVDCLGRGWRKVGNRLYPV